MDNIHSNKSEAVRYEKQILDFLLRLYSSNSIVTQSKVTMELG